MQKCTVGRPVRSSALASSTCNAVPLGVGYVVAGTVATRGMSGSKWHEHLLEPHLDGRLGAGFAKEKFFFRDWLAARGLSYGLHV